MSPRSWHSRLFTKISQLCQFRGCHLFRPPLPGDERPRARDPHPDRHRGLRPAVLQVAAPRAGRRAPRRTRVWNLLEYARRNPTLTTVEKSRAIDPEVLADLEAVCNTKGIVRDPKLLRRITERADQVRQETLKQFGVQEIGAEIIRTMHDPE